MKRNNLLPIIPKDKNVIKYITLMGQIGIVMVSSILISFIIFYFIGKKLNILKFTLPIGIIIGVFAGFYSVYKLLKRFFEKDNKNENSN